MRAFRIIALLALAFAASGCASKFRTYDGPEVTRVVVYKQERQMHLLHGAQTLRSFDFELGFAPEGHKQVEGDGRTPEGRYLIDRRNPDSRFHLSIGIDYPRPQDIAVAQALGQAPGGDIFIHGTPKPFRRKDDWTWGCIAVTNREMEDIYAMVRDGTVVDIYASARQAALYPNFEDMWPASDPGAAQQDAGAQVARTQVAGAQAAE